MTKKVKPEVDRISSILRGVTMHLGILQRRCPDLVEPIEALESIIRHIEDGDPLK